MELGSENPSLVFSVDDSSRRDRTVPDVDLLLLSVGQFRNQGQTSTRDHDLLTRGEPLPCCRALRCRSPPRVAFFPASSAPQPAERIDHQAPGMQALISLRRVLPCLLRTPPLKKTIPCVKLKNEICLPVSSCRSQIDTWLRLLFGPLPHFPVSTLASAIRSKAASRPAFSEPYIEPSSYSL